MPRISTAEIDLPLLEMLFEEFNIWVKTQDGRLTTEPIPERTVASTRWPDSLSQIVKHRLPNGKHIATTHRVIALDGTVYHQDAKDILLQGLRLWRR